VGVKKSPSSIDLEYPNHNFKLKKILYGYKKVRDHGMKG